MSERPTLSSIFEATKDELANSLSGLMLPRDSERVQLIIVNYLNTVCDENNDYRQNLTQSEDYILQAALSMLSAQRDLVAAFDVKPSISISRPNSGIREDAVKTSLTSARINTGATLVGAGSGAIVGKILFGGWGTVFGAVAGTAVALYLSQQPKKYESQNNSIETVPIKPEIVISDTPVDTSNLLSVIAQICDSLDNLIETFRAQVKRVVNKYESHEKPTIESEYRTLLEGIQSLLGYKRGHNASEDKYLGKLQERIEDLAELLDNYSLEAVDYTEDKSSWFDAVESEKSTGVKLVAPAIVKNGTLIIKGKIFIPKG